MGSIWACNSVCVPLERKTRLRDIQKIRLGHFSLFCVCLPLPRTLHCSVLCTLNVLYLSCLRSALAENCVFDITNVKRQWNWTIRAVITLAHAIANDCKKEIWFVKQLALACLLACLLSCLLARWSGNRWKKCCTSKMSYYSDLSLCNSYM